MTSQAVQQPTPKNPALALILSLFWCGVGQIYNGQVGKGVALLISYGVSLLLMFVIIGFFTTPCLWIFGMVDAYRTAERLNQQTLGPQKRCPFCAELIQAGAVVCRHCGRDVSAQAPAQLSSQPMPNSLPAPTDEGPSTFEARWTRSDEMAPVQSGSKLHCPGCGSEVPREARFCATCGRQTASA